MFDLKGDSAIEFKSGEITSLAAHAQLHLNGNDDAFIEDSTAPGSNSALTGLASIGAGAILGLHNKAAVSTSGALANDGTVRLDAGPGDGGSSLTVGGTLTNSAVGRFEGSLDVGNATLSASDSVTAAALDNSRLGDIVLQGSGANQALLDVTSGAAGFGTAGVLSGYVQLLNDSAIEFASGEITSLAGWLTLTGNDAFIEDRTALGSNSALTGLADVTGSLYLEDGASVSTTGALVIDGGVSLGDGGSSLTVGGTLTTRYVPIRFAGSLDVSASDEVTAAALDNTGSINLSGSSAGQALLDVTGSAGFGTAGVLTGTVNLYHNSAIEFASGEITSLSGWLTLTGKEAFIEDSTALGSNSALTGLSDVAGDLYVKDGASVSTTGALTNSGYISVNNGATLLIGGALTNTGTLAAQASASLNVSGATTNNGGIFIVTDTTAEFAGPVGGTGSFGLANANLQFDSSVSSGQTIDESGADALTLEQAQNFAATISGFGTGDTIDATNFLAPPATTYNFVENIAGTGGTLTLTDTSLSLTANIQMTGDYSNKSFTLAPDSGTGTLVKFV